MRLCFLFFLFLFSFVEERWTANWPAAEETPDHISDSSGEDVQGSTYRIRLNLGMSSRARARLPFGRQSFLFSLWPLGGGCVLSVIPFASGTGDLRNLVMYEGSDMVYYRILLTFLRQFQASQAIAQDGFELLILLGLPPECQDLQACAFVWFVKIELSASCRNSTNRASSPLLKLFNTLILCVCEREHVYVLMCVPHMS